jgi:hypothetical protein
MTKGLYKKPIVLAIIGLFVGGCIMPSISGNTKQTSESSVSKTKNFESINYIRFDDFEDYSIGEAPKAERGWSTSGITQNQYIEACADPLNPNNMVMKIHASSADTGIYCQLHQYDFATAGSYAIHYSIYSPALSMTNTIYEWFCEENTGKVIIHRRTGRLDGRVIVGVAVIMNLIHLLIHLQPSGLKKKLEQTKMNYVYFMIIQSTF